ncbi:MAG TPA: hypothetical protein ENK57_23220, partial [Polyangiaceae bacterium]|nr:hypothetical protein [Polyangiaceae bacterium]
MERLWAPLVPSLRWLSGSDSAMPIEAADVRHADVAFVLDPVPPLQLESLLRAFDRVFEVRVPSAAPGGGLPGFWDLYYGRPVSEILIVEHRRGEPSPRLRRRVEVTTKQPFRAYVTAICELSARLPAEASSGTFDHGHTTTSSWSSTPELPQIVYGVGKTLVGSMNRRFDWAIRQPTWSIGLIERPIGAVAPDDTTIWFEPPRHHLWADPFGVRTPEGLTILAEELDLRDGVGRIIQLAYAEGKVNVIGRDVLSCKGHASYPFLLRDEGAVFCVPETSQDREVALYRARDLTHGDWVKETTLLSGVQAVDSSLTFHEGTWFM